jgi:tetrahydromethanopterin S-methyltransferase subunit G
VKRKATIFCIFGVLQGVVLGSIIFLVFKSLNTISTVKVIGLDTQILLSILFPLFLLIVEYLIYSKE